MICSALVGSVLWVYSFLAVFSLSLTVVLSRFMLQYSARWEISMNWSRSWISCGISLSLSAAVFLFFAVGAYDYESYLLRDSRCFVGRA